jgi:carbonic anhydrase
LVIGFLVAGCASSQTAPDEIASHPTSSNVSTDVAAKSPSSEMELKLVPANPGERGTPVLLETEVGDLRNQPVPSSALAPASGGVGQPERKDDLYLSPAPSAKSEQAAKKKDSHGHAFGGGIEPSKSLQWLKNGNIRFVKGSLRKDGQSKKDVSRLSKGQKPHAIVLSCSDSRLPPELVFDQKLGELFTVRTAGESLDSSVIASIEYAVAHLGARLILVMGHTSCGAVKAAVDTLGGGDTGSPHIDYLVKDIHPRIRSVAGGNGSPGLRKESWANAKGVAGELEARSSIIAEAVRSGQVQIVSALYNLPTGEVDFE